MLWIRRSIPSRSAKRQARRPTSPLPSASIERSSKPRIITLATTAGSWSGDTSANAAKTLETANPTLSFVCSALIVIVLVGDSGLNSFLQWSTTFPVSSRPPQFSGAKAVLRRCRRAPSLSQHSSLGFIVAPSGSGGDAAGCRAGSTPAPGGQNRCGDQAGRLQAGTRPGREDRRESPAVREGERTAAVESPRSGGRGHYFAPRL